MCTAVRLGAIFAALLGTEEHGRWLIAPASPIRATRRRYRGDTMVLETEFDTDEGTVRLIDFMPIRGEAMDVVRIVEGVRGRVPCAWTCGCGSTTATSCRGYVGSMQISWPWRVPMRCGFARRSSCVGEFVYRRRLQRWRGFQVPFVLVWQARLPTPQPVDPMVSLEATEAYWQEWRTGARWGNGATRSCGPCSRSRRSTRAHRRHRRGRDNVARSNGAAQLGLSGSVGRDATITLQSLMYSGYVEEARDWRHHAARDRGRPR